jgi:DNA-binding protein H-NS
MNTDKIKRKIAEGHTDEEIAAMAGTTAEEISKVRTPAPKPAPKAAPKKAASKKAAGKKK